jgi:hypothetical protein
VPSRALIACDLQGPPTSGSTGAWSCLDSVLTKLEQLNERLDRIERSAAVALMPAQAPAPASSPTPAPKLTTGLVQAPAPTLAAKVAEKPPAPALIRKIAEWVVCEVVNGKAILQGPRGLIGVSTGDLVPSVGRVESIARSRPKIFQARPRYRAPLATIRADARVNVWHLLHRDFSGLSVTEPSSANICWRRCPNTT